jgi:hypothetical protein
LQTPPSDEQRVVWRTFLDNRAHIVDDIVDGARAAYVRQRSARLFWWIEMYGGDDDPLLPEALPEIQTISELRKLVRPHRFVIWESRESHRPPLWLAIQFDASWDRGSDFAALVRDDQVVQFGSHELAESLPAGPSQERRDAVRTRLGALRALRAAPASSTTGSDTRGTVETRRFAPRRRGTSSKATSSSRQTRRTVRSPRSRSRRSTLSCGTRSTPPM